MHPKDALGRRGEQAAAEYLESAGFRVLDQNYRCSDGELDIVASDRRALVVCEVKTRSDVRFGTPVEAVTPRKLHRLRRLAIGWIKAHGVSYDDVRVDIIGVLRKPSGDFEIEHIRGVG